MIVSQKQDELAEEEPLEIRVRGRAISVTMRTPGHDADLAAGFLLTEGIIHRREDILAIRHCPHNRDQNVINVSLARDMFVDFDQLTRHVFASSSCGLCGKATIQSIHGWFPPVQSDMVIDARLRQEIAGNDASAQATSSTGPAASMPPRSSIRQAE